MKSWFYRLSLLLLAALGVQGAGMVREESVTIFGARRISLVPPAGFALGTARDESGRMAIRVSDAKGLYSLEIAFLSDAEGRHSGARARRELINELFSGYVGSSKEKGLQFEELEPRTGAGTFCVFTDASLVGKAELPPGEYLHLTAGVKTWPGVVAVFRLFSDDTSSAEYQLLMKMLRESLVEKAVPLR